MVKEEEAGEDAKVLTLIDSRNGFNELFCLVILWTVSHQWPSGARFALNCCRNETQLVVRRPAALCYLLMSIEGVNQGYPLSVVLYVLALLPLVEAMREADPGVL